MTTSKKKTAAVALSSPSTPSSSLPLPLVSTATSVKQTQKLLPPHSQSQMQSSSSNKSNSNNDKDNNKNDDKNLENEMEIFLNLKALEERADQGDPEAQYRLGQFYHQESAGGNHSILFAKQAALYWSSAAQQGHAKAQFAFGQRYHGRHLGLESLVQDSGLSSLPIPLCHHLPMAVSWYGPTAVQCYLESGGTGNSNNHSIAEFVEQVSRTHETVKPTPPSSARDFVGDSNNLEGSEVSNKNDPNASLPSLALGLPASSSLVTMVQSSNKHPLNPPTMGNSTHSSSQLLSSTTTRPPPLLGRGPAKLVFKLQKRQHLQQQQLQDNQQCALSSRPPTLLQAVWQCRQKRSPNLRPQRPGPTKWMLLLHDI